MQISNVEVSVLRGSEETPLKEYGLDGRTFVEARESSEYAIRIRNNNPYRILAVPSVDGLSVLDGKPATPDGIGYIVEAYGKLTVKGFRQSNDAVGAFKFSKKEKSYVAGKGDASNVGVIAVAVFQEKTKPKPAPQIQIIEKTVYRDRWPWEPYPYWGYNTTLLNCTTTQNGSCGTTFTANCGSDVKATAGSNSLQGTLRGVNCSATVAQSSVEESQLGSPCADTFQAGTEWGKRVEDKVTEATFEKEHANPFAEFVIYYDFRPGLESLGIKIVPEKQVAFPKGFPGKFAEPPSGWVG